MNNHFNNADFVTAAFLFFATILMYNLDRLFGDEWPLIKTYFQALTKKNSEFVKSHAKVTFQLVFALPALALFLFIPNAQKITLIVPAFVAFLYALPIGSGQLRLRELPFAKIFSIAFVWAWLGAFLCTPVGEITFNNSILFVDRFLLIYAITIPFDLRDMVVDEQKSLATIPIKMGVRKSLSSAVIAFLLMLFSLWFVNEGLLRIGVVVVSMLLVLSWTKERTWPYYLFLIDGCIILDSLAILL
ncbi:MAG: hypothetical protein JXQ87_01790 [Bacteroidia bacterium]